MTFIERYVINDTGAITFTGNTLGLSRSNTVGVPGTVDSIGAYIITDTSVQFGTYPAGTTNVFQNNSSAAILNLPPGSTVLYAELIWGGTYIDNQENNSAFINKDVILTTPVGVTTVSPDPATAREVVLSTASGFPRTFAYVRSSDVTDLIRVGGAGTYVTGGVVGTLSIPDPTSNNAGWTLGVVYRNPGFPLRNLSIRVGAEVILSTSGPVTTPIEGFATPFIGPLSGRALLGAQEGDANKSGDQALFGPNVSTLRALSGPNNFATNFFASQINGDTGALNTTGTFGNRNQINGTPGTNIVGGRQGWDITNVDVSNTLVNTQTSALLRLTTSGDGYLVDSFALQININTPVITATKTASEQNAIVGDTITYSVLVENTSVSNATDVIVFDNIPVGSSFIPDSVTINGVQQPGSEPITGIFVGALPANTSVIVTFQVQVTSLPTPPRLFDQAKVGYTAPTVPDGPIISNEVPSNTVTIPVFQPDITIVKSADTANALIGSTVTYTLVVTNIGNIDALTTVTDPIPDGSNFVPGSVTVNGTVQPADDPVTGINLGNVAIGDTVTITFQVRVTGLLRGFNLTNQGTANYTAQLPDGRVITDTSVSNIVTVTVSTPTVSVTKTASAIDAVVGDTLTYTIVISNTDTDPINSVVFTDAIPTGSVFIPGSVTVDGIVQPTADPTTGVSLGTIGPGVSVTVTFSTNVIFLPDPSELADQAQVTFISGPFEAASFSDPLTIPVYQPVIITTKSSDPAFAVVGQTITYQINVTNTGNIAASLTLTDVIPSDAAFVSGTVIANGVPLPAADPNAGISLGTLAPGDRVFITFQVIVNTLPGGQQLTNQATTDFTFSPPDGRVISGSAPSNEIIIPISTADPILTKTADISDAVEGDVITYTVVLDNIESFTVNNIIFTDSISPGTVYIPDSFTLDGRVIPGADPFTGINIGSIPGNTEVIVTFKVSVSDLPAPLPNPFNLTDQATINFIVGTTPLQNLSNIVTTPVYGAIIDITKTSSDSNAIVGDTITYSLLVNNTGNLNADVILFDPLPPGETFIQNSVFINGNRWSGTSPVTGIILGTVSPGFPVFITFQVAVTSLPDPPILNNQTRADYIALVPDGRVLSESVLSNIVSIPVTADNIISVVKSAPVNHVQIGEVITYTLVINNNVSLPINDILLTDPIPAGTTFVPGSVTVDGAVIADANPATGIRIDMIMQNGTAVVTFQVVVNDSVINEPEPVLLINQANVQFTTGNFTDTVQSNTVIIPVQIPFISIYKAASIRHVQIGDTVQYQLSVSNEGQTPANVILFDPLSSNTSFVEGSVVSGGLSLPTSNPATGIAVGSIAPGQTIEVSFLITIISIPPSLEIINQAIANISFLTADGRTLTYNSQSNRIILNVSNPNVSINKTANRPDVSPGDSIIYTIYIRNNNRSPISSVVLTDSVPPGTSFVTGSVVVNGVATPTGVPANGIILGIIPPGGTTTISFQVIVNENTTLSSIINQANLRYTLGQTVFTIESNPTNVLVTSTSTTQINLQKTADKTSVVVGDTITYQARVTNTGNTVVQVTITDSIPTGTRFVDGSVRLDGQPIAGANPAAGIFIAALQPGQIANTTFEVIVINQPVGGNIVNQFTATFQAQGQATSGSLQSNTVVIPSRLPQLTIVKSANKHEVEVHSHLRYKILIHNASSLPASDVILKDAIQAESTFIAGSVVVNGQLQPDGDIVKGLPLGTIAPGATVDVQFNVLVHTIPEHFRLLNQALLHFNIALPDGSLLPSFLASNKTDVEIIEQEE
ncbi:MAG: beta strand repeat-containing protein [Paenibacillus sp.]|uniref:beta strand repeat-containing protein n=1 Tax=Paenibacillus sp. TaxID=58172 RepID=UPI003B810F24